MDRSILVSGFRRSAGGVAALATLLLGSKACSDLTAPAGVNDVSVQYRLAAGQTRLDLIVGDSVRPDVVVMLGGTETSRARYVFTSSDPNVIRVYANGDSIVAEDRGTATLVVTLVGTTIGNNRVNPNSRTADTIVVAAAALTNVVSPASVTFDALGARQTVVARSLGRNGKVISGTSIEWRTTAPGVVSVAAIDDSTAELTSVGNGAAASVYAVFGGVDSTSAAVTVSQQLKRYILTTPSSPNLRSINETMTVTARAVDSLNNTIDVAGGAPVPPTPSFQSDNPGKVEIDPATGMMTALGNTTEPVRISATVGGAVRSDTLPVTVTQFAASLTIQADTIRLLSIGDKSANINVLAPDALGTQVPSASIRWTPDDPSVVQVEGQVPATFTALATGTTVVRARADQQVDSVVVIVTNDPAFVTLAPKPLALRSLNEQQTLTATVTNSAGTALPAAVTWTSRNPAIAELQPAPGVVVARATGETYVVAATANGRADSAFVRVTNAPDTVNIVPTDLTLASIGDTDGTFAVDLKNALGATLPRTAANWSSLDVTVARAVDGAITATGPGVTYVVAVSPENANRRDSVRVTVTNAPASVTVTPDPTALVTSLGTTTGFTAVVRNQAGSVIQNAPVTWSVQSGTSVAVNAATGVATAIANGSSTVRATADGVFDDVDITVAQAISTTRSTITPAATSIVANGASTTAVTVRLRDAADSLITSGGATVTLALSPAIATLSAVTDNGDGTYGATLTAGTTSGSVTISGTVNGATMALTGVVNLTPAPASQYVVSVSPNLLPVAGTAVTVSARLADASGNTVPTAGNVVAWASTGGGSFSAATSTTDATGVATVTFTTSSSATTHSVTATTGAISGTSQPITPTAGAATHYGVTAASTSPVAGSTIVVSAQLLDANDNAVRLAGQTVTWSRSDANGSFSAATSQTDASGVATVSFTTHTMAGTATTVTATTGPLAGTSATITTIPAGASQLLVAQPPSATPQSGVAFATQPAVQLRDAFGNNVAAANIAISAALTAGGGSLGGATTVLTDAGGLATFTDLAISGTVGARTLAFTASGVGSTTANVTLIAGPAQQIAVQAGNGQSAAVGTTVAVAPSVVVRDAAGNPVSGVDVTFTVTSGGGTIVPASPAVVTTDASGVAALSSWTLGTSAGANALEATVAGQALSGEPVAFSATGTVGAATAIAANSVSSQGATVGTSVSSPPSVIVSDANGNPVPGFSVTFTLTATGGSGGAISPASAASVLTNSAGVATLASWTLGQSAGTDNNTVTATGAGLATITFNASGTAGAAQNIVGTSSAAQSATVATAVTPPAIRVRDAYNNPVAGIPVTFALTSSGGTGGAITPLTAVVTDANGDAALTSWTLGQSSGTGNNVVTATVAGLTGSPVTFTASGTPGAAQTVVANSALTQNAVVGSNVTAPPSVVVHDQFGNPVGAGIGVTFTLTANGGGGGAIAPASVATVNTSASGVATLTSWTLGGTAGAPNTVDATVGTSTVTFTATGTSASAQSIVANSVTTQSAVVGTAVAAPPSVLVRDASTNPVAAFPVTFTVTAAGGTGGAIDPASPTTVFTDGSGVATLTSWTLGQATGSANNTVTATGSGLATVVFNASGTPAAPASLVANSATSQSAMVGTTAAAPPSVVVRDAFGNAVGAGVSVTFTLTAAGGAGGAIDPASVATVATNASGVASLTSWTLGQTAGTNSNTVTATIPTLNTVTFNASGTAGAATSIAAQSATAQSATVATSVSAPPSVLVTDASGNPVSGFAVTFTLTAAGGAGGAIGPVSPATVLTNTSGVATLSSWMLGQTAGTNNNTVTATGAGLATVTFNASGTAGAAQNIIANSTTSQAVTVATNATAPSVVVRDAFNNPVAGTTVTFSLAASGGAGGAIDPVSPAGVVTDASGVATLTTWTLGQTAGTANNVVTAAVAGLTGSPITFSASGTADVPASLTANSATAQSGTVGTAVSAAPSVIVRDQFGNAVGAGIDVTFTLTATGGAGGAITPASPATVATSAAGVATLTSWTLGQSAGADNNTVTATIPTLNTVTFNASGTAGTATQLAITAQPSPTATAGIPFTQQPVLELRDAFGNLVTSNNSTVVTATRAAGSGTLQGTTSTTAVAGVATFANLAHGSAGTITIQFTASGLVSATSDNVVVAGGTKYLVTAARSTVAAGDTVTVVAQLADAADNPVAIGGKTVNWSRTGVGGSFPGGGATSTSLTDASGRAEIVFTVHTAATTVHTVTATDNTLLTGTSGNVTVVAAAPSQMAFVVEPTDAEASAAIAPAIEVEVRDAFGNPVLADPDAGATETITLAFTAGTNTEGATLAGTLPQSINWATGRATFADVSADLPGSYALTATEGGFGVAIADANSVAFSILATTATISASSNATETTWNDGTLTVQVTNGTFVATPAAGDFSLGGAPAGTTIAGVTRNSDTEVVLAVDFDGTDFDADATIAVDVLASALATGVAVTAGNSITVTPAAANAVVLTGPAAVAANTVSGAFTLQAIEPNASSMTVAANSVFDLAENVGAGTQTFYSDAGGVTPITQATISSGTSSVDVYYRDTEPGSADVTATWNNGGTDLGTDTHTITVDATTAAIGATTPVTLAESTLNGATLTIDITNGVFGATPLAGDFALVALPPGTTIANVVRNSDTQVVLTLAFAGSGAVGDSTISVRVESTALASGIAATTGTVPVTDDVP